MQQNGELFKEHFFLPDPDISEPDFLRHIALRARSAGRVDPVFPGMVLYNVSLYLLRNVWPERLARWKESPFMLGFAANESGWKGKLSHLRSTFDPATGLAQLDKAFVMEGSHCLSLCAVRAPNASAAPEEESRQEARMDFAGPEKSPSDGDSGAPALNNVAICLIPLSEVQCTARDDPESLFEFEGQRFRHYRIQGTYRLHSDEVVVLDSSRYRRLAPQFMMREITGLGAIALGLLLNKNTGQTAEKALEAELESYCAEVGEARQKGRPGKRNLKWAGEIISRLCQKDSQIHPLWHRLNSNRSL